MFSQKIGKGSVKFQPTVKPRQNRSKEKPSVPVVPNVDKDAPPTSMASTTSSDSSSTSNFKKDPSSPNNSIPTVPSISPVAPSIFSNKQLSKPTSHPNVSIIDTPSKISNPQRATIISAPSSLKRKIPPNNVEAKNVEPPAAALPTKVLPPLTLISRGKPSKTHFPSKDDMVTSYKMSLFTYSASAKHGEISKNFNRLNPKSRSQETSHKQLPQDLKENKAPKEKKPRTVEHKPNTSTSAAPQVRIVNGQIVLDEESLQIERSDLQQTQERPTEIVEEFGSYVNNGSFRKKVSTKKWTKEETQLFYKALRVFGTDFNLIAKMFPDRNRTHIKRKYIKEEAADPAKIRDCFFSKEKMALEEYAEMAGIEEFGPELSDVEDLLKPMEKVKKEEKTEPKQTTRKVKTKVEVNNDEEEIVGMIE